MKLRNKIEYACLLTSRFIVIGRTLCALTGTLILTTFFPPFMAIALCIAVWKFGRPQGKVSTTHGSARWASVTDLESSGCLFREHGGFIGEAVIGQPLSIWRRWRALLFSPFAQSQRALEISSTAWKKPLPLIVRTPETSPHMFVFGASGSGKSTSFAVQMLLRSNNSMVVFDPKGELTRISAHHRDRNLDQAVYVIDPYEISGSRYQGHSLNPLDCFRDNELLIVDEARRLASALIVSRNENDRFWSDASISLVTAIIAFLLAAGKDGASLNHLRDVTSNAELLEDTLAYMSKCNACEGMLKRLAGEIGTLEGRTRSSVLSVTNSNLSFLDSVLISRVLARSTFDPKVILNQKATIYVCLPIDRLHEMAALQRIILTTLINIVFAAGESDRAPIEFLIDEAAALEEISSLYAGLQFGRSFGIRIRALYQSVSQLERSFPDSQKHDVLATVSKVYAGSDDYTTARDISESMGTRTVMATTQQVGSNLGRSENTGIQEMSTNRSWGTNDSVSNAEQSRPLLTPAEVLTLPRHLGIALLPGIHPVLFKKMPYYADRPRRLVSLGLELCGNIVVGVAIAVFLLFSVWFFAWGQFDPEVRQAIENTRNILDR